MGEENFRSYLNMKWSLRANEQVTDIYSVVDRGPYALVQQLMLPMGTVFAESVSAVVLFVVLLSLDPITALTTAVFFVSVAVLQHRVLSVTMSDAGKTVANEMNETYNILSDSFQLGKVLQVMPSQSLETELTNSRLRLAKSRAKTLFLESLPRYLMESMLAIGVVVIGTVTVMVRGSEYLLASLSVFAVAGFRLLPIVNRIQGLILGLLGREPLARMALREIDERDKKSVPHATIDEPSEHILRLENVSFNYPGTNEVCLSDVSFSFRRGLQYAIVGPSGSGKTTLVDLCMGLHEPSSGAITWSLSPNDSLGYVPQENPLAGQSLESNVAIEWNSTDIDLPKVQTALAEASLSGLSDVLQERENSTLINLSGGQRQRVGLARALYRNSSVLFLDEPTSALDAETEHEVMQIIKKMHGNTTVIIVAHRLSTIKDADIVIYLEAGKILGSGSFDELRRTLPEFAYQIKLGFIGTDDAGSTP